MKVLIVLILTLVTVDIFGQGQVTPIYYLNSEKIDFEYVHIKSSSIDEIVVDKETEKSAVYMTTKRKIKFLTLDEILKDNSGILDSTGQVVYMVDDNLVEDKSKVKVDDSYFIDVKVKRLENVIYINDRYNGLILVDIRLLNEKPKPEIRIRGDEGLQTRNLAQRKWPAANRADNTASMLAHTQTISPCRV